jgi:hypothetical protein
VVILCMPQDWQKVGRISHLVLELGRVVITAIITITVLLSGRRPASRQGCLIVKGRFRWGLTRMRDTLRIVTKAHRPRIPILYATSNAVVGLPCIRCIMVVALEHRTREFLILFEDKAFAAQGHAETDPD